MLTVMCPNCRHRFPAPGCCNTDENPTAATTSASVNLEHRPTNSSGGLLFVDASNHTSGHHHQQVTISTQCGIQSGGCLIQSSNAEILLHSSALSSPHRLEVRSKLSGGGGCIVQKRMEPEYADNSTGLDNQRDQCRPLLISEEQLRSSFEQAAQFHRSHSTTARLEPAPSGCQELPGTRREKPPQGGCVGGGTSRCCHAPRQHPGDSCECRCSCYCRCCYTYCRNSTPGNEQTGCRRNLCQVAATGEHHIPRCGSKEPDDACPTPEDATPADNCSEGSKYLGDVRIQVNATVHLPSTSTATLGSCTLNITASTSTSSTCTSALNFTSNVSGNNRLRNNLNGGGIVTLNNNSNNVNGNNVNGNNVINVSNGSSTSNATYNSNTRDETPGTPVSWLMPCPWSFDGYMPDKDVAKLAEVRRLLQTCGWYHEGLSWQQSENLLKDAPVGRWLMRDSSDSRYTFAISVQTARGPTSVRVFYFMGKFRLDAEPRLALAMPLFDCPIKMLEYYCEYSKRMDEHRQEVWVDYSGQVYSQIYLSEPLVKEVRSLSHLARIAVNRGGAKLEKEKEKLPPLIRNYLKEYPYTL